MNETLKCRHGILIEYNPITGTRLAVGHELTLCELDNDFCRGSPVYCPYFEHTVVNRLPGKGRHGTHV